jgi:predicted Zn-dependent peptidase
MNTADQSVLSQQTSLSQETIEEAASQATEEAVAEAQAEQLRLSTEAELDSTSLQSQSSLLRSLESSDASSLDMLAAQSVLDAESGSTVDSTLEEIKKLRIIDSELARANGDQESSAEPDKINEQ